MNTEQLVEMTHRLAPLALTPFRLGFHEEVPIRLVVSRIRSSTHLPLVSPIALPEVRE